MAHTHRNSSDAFPSSPPTGPTRVLDDSDDDDSDEYDFRSEVGGPETYEMIASGADASGAAVQKNRPRERRRRSSSVASFELYTPEEEAIVRRTFDRKLVLFVALLFLLSFLDRSSKPPFLFPLSLSFPPHSTPHSHTLHTIHCTVVYSVNPPC